jgi:argininosuccinate synthase
VTTAPIHIRPATLADVPPIAALIAADARKGGLLPRSPESITAAIDNFMVAEATGLVVGCGALAPMSPNLVELRSLAISKDLRGGGVGKKLALALVENARRRRFGTIYALTRAVDFFKRCGFEVREKEEFPEKVWHDCVNCPLIAHCDEVAVAMDLAWEEDDATAGPPPVTRHGGGRSGEVKKVVLAYSGGLDTSCAVPWLIETYGCEVICFVANVGQQDDLTLVEERALSSGASKVVIKDLREEFATEYLYPLIQSGAIYERKYLLGASVVRPLIAKHQVELAEAEGADALAHGATGKGNDQVRFELAYMAHNPDLTVIAPWREWQIKGRDDALAYARSKGIAVTESMADIYSDDDNLWHISHEGGRLEDPWLEPDEAIYQFTVSPEKAPDEPEYVEIDFVSGMPKEINGQPMKAYELIRTLNLLGARHGVGRVDLVENRLVGMKSHGVYETPGGTILRAAHMGIEELVLDRETMFYKQQIALKYADVVYTGRWFTPLRDALQAFVAVTQRDVTGTARIKLYKGNATLVGRKANYSTYREDLATFMSDDIYDQTDATGFITLYGLPSLVKARVDRNRAGHPAPTPGKRVERRD